LIFPWFLRSKNRKRGDIPPQTNFLLFKKDIMAKDKNVTYDKQEYFFNPLSPSGLRGARCAMCAKLMLLEVSEVITD